jgi:hypothetical protein
MSPLAWQRGAEVRQFNRHLSKLSTGLALSVGPIALKFKHLQRALPPHSSQSTWLTNCIREVGGVVVNNLQTMIGVTLCTSLV